MHSSPRTNGPVSCRTVWEICSESWNATVILNAGQRWRTLPFLKQELARATAEMQRLQSEESDAASQVASEQAHWAEINQRLEDLDRALTRR